MIQKHLKRNIGWTHYILPKISLLNHFFFLSNLNQNTFARFDRSRTVSVVWAPTSSKDVIAGTFNWVCPFLGS